MDKQSQAQAIEAIRRRVETATDARTRVKLLVIEEAVRTGLMIEPTGQIIDVTGDVYGYGFGLYRAGAEFVGDPLAYISITPIIDADRDAFSRYAKCANQALKIDEHEKETCLQLIYTYLGIG